MPSENGQEEMEILYHNVSSGNLTFFSVPASYQGNSKEHVNEIEGRVKFSFYS